MVAQTQLLTSVSVTSVRRILRCPRSNATGLQAKRPFTAQCTKTYCGALLVVTNRNPLSYDLLGLLGDLEIAMNLPEIGRHQRTGKCNQTWSLWRWRTYNLKTMRLGESTERLRHY